MAEETDLSRTEPASARRLQEARRAGDVPRSAELTRWLVLLAALGMLGWLAPRLLDALRTLFRTALRDAAQPFSTAWTESALAVLWAVLPFLAVLFAAALVAPMLLSGWVYAPGAAQADFTRANPFKSLFRLFSADAWFDGALALLKLVLAGAAIAWAVTNGWPEWQAPGSRVADDALGMAAAWVGHGVIALAAVLALAAALDAGWRWWRYLRRHAMTWQEVLAEARESEVSPEVRARIRGRQQQAGQGPRLGANVDAMPSPSPQSSPAGEGANVMPKTINEVIG